MHDNKSTMINKYAPPFLAVLMAFAIHCCNTKHIARWRMSWPSLEAAGRRHQVTICTILPWWPPGSSVLAHTTKVVAVKMAPPKLAKKKAQNWRPTHVIDTASFVKLWHCTIGAEELSYFSSYQHWQRTKIGELTKHQRSLSKSGRSQPSYLAVKLLRGRL